MRDIPDYFWEWTELDYNTGKRLVKPDAPPDILKKLVDDERDEFSNTWRRCIINVDLETGRILPTEDAVRLYKEFESQKRKQAKEK